MKNINNQKFNLLHFSAISAMAFGLFLTATSCSGDTGEKPVGALVEPETPTANIEEATPTQTPTPAPTPKPATTPTLGENPGSSGLGDPYFPTLGNGGYDVEEYDLQLLWDPGSKYLVGEATITAKIVEDLTSLNLDLSGMTVTSVKFEGSNLDFFREDNELIIVFQQPVVKGTMAALEISYQGFPGLVENLNLPHSGGWFNTENMFYVSGEPSSSQAWHPVNDHPDDRAQFRIEFTAIPLVEARTWNWEFVTNGFLVEKTESDVDKSITWIYETRYPRAPYLTVLAYGIFKESEAVTLGDVHLRHWAESPPLPSDIFEAGVETFGHDYHAMFEVFTNLFGPYPFDTYGYLVLNETLGYALETQTLSIFGYDTYQEPNIHVHELAHQWFGNHITVGDWSNIWLNEGFATYAEYLFLEESVPSFSIDDSFFIPMYELVEQGNTFFTQPPPGDPGRDNLFSASVYFRGAMTLHALRLTIGDALFFDSIRGYVEQYGGQSATTNDFIQLVEEATGSDLEEFFNGWLFQDNLPPLQELYD